MTSKNQLTMSQASELRLLEQQISGNLRDAWGALLRIRDRKLYIAEGTFENYCSSRWKLTKSQIYKLLRAAGVKDLLENDIPPKSDKQGVKLDTLNNHEEGALPQNKSQLLALAQAPPDQQALAWQATVATADGKPTAADVKEVVEVIAEAPKAALKKLATAVKSGEPEKVEEVIAEIRGEESEEEVVKDAIGNVVHESVADVFGTLPEWKEAMQAISKAKQLGNALPHAGWLDQQEFERLLSQARALLKFAAPHCECAKCRRKVQKSCPACKGMGWVHKSNFNSSFSDADKKWLEKA